jgi:hypothetical protein
LSVDFIGKGCIPREKMQLMQLMLLMQLFPTAPVASINFTKQSQNRKTTNTAKKPSKKRA